MNVAPLGNGRYEVSTDAGRMLAYGIRRGGEAWIFLDGCVYVVGGHDDQRTRGAQHDDAALAAPMPATVVAIHVVAGQQVQAGDVLVVLEAMKMELAVAASHAGRVSSIACRVGELVEPGVPLVVLED